MNRKILLIVLFVVFAIGIGYYFFSDSPQISTESVDSPITLNLEDYFETGQTGMATLTDLGNGQTQIVLEMKDYESDGTQPAHIHEGSCPQVGPVLYSLTPVENNYSETTLDASLAKILSQSEELNINVHKSTEEIHVYTSCGNILK